MIKESHYYYYTCTLPIPIFWHICVSIPTGFHGAHLCPPAGFQEGTEGREPTKVGEERGGIVRLPVPTTNSCLDAPVVRTPPLHAGRCRSRH